MAERIVRITYTQDVVVAAEYGDTDDSLLQKAAESPAGREGATYSLLPTQYETEVGEELDPSAPPENPPEPAPVDPEPQPEPVDPEPQPEPTPEEPA